MSYTIGASHGPFSGNGSFVISKPAGIRTVLTGIPGWTAHDTSLPPRFFRIGRFTLGNTHGFQNSVPIEYEQQVIYPLPPDWELLAYDIRNGASCTFYELVAVPDLSLKQPWDRTPLPMFLDARPVATGATADTVAWTYTVPVGRRLLMAKLRCAVIRHAAATTVFESFAYIRVNSVLVTYAVLRGNVVGQEANDDLNSGPLVLNAGQTIDAHYCANVTGGTVSFNLLASGTLFDA